MYLCNAADQYKWLQRDLANVDRKVTPWLVGVWHPPWYNTYVSHYKEVECMRVAMEEMLYNAGVDIIFNGHVSVFMPYNIRCVNFVTWVDLGPFLISNELNGSNINIVFNHITNS